MEPQISYPISRILGISNLIFSELPYSVFTTNFLKHFCQGSVFPCMQLAMSFKRNCTLVQYIALGVSTVQSKNIEGITVGSAQHSRIHKSLRNGFIASL